MQRYQLPLRIFEQPVRDPQTPAEAEANKNMVQIKTDVVITGRNVDDVLARAKDHLAAEGRVVRSVNIGPAEITAVVYKSDVKMDPRTMRESRLRRGR